MEIIKCNESKELLNGHLLNFERQIHLRNQAAMLIILYIFLPLSVVESSISIKGLS